MSRRAALALVCAACRAEPADVPMLDAAVALPAEPAMCGAGAAVSVQGALFDSQYNTFVFDGATVTIAEAPSRIEIVGATAQITLFVDTAAREYSGVSAQLRLGSELSATQLAHVVIDQSDSDCVAGRFEVARMGRVVGSFHTR